MDASTLINLHENWAWVVIVGNGLAGIWSLAAHKVAPLRTRALWWYIAIAQASMFIQVILGVIMVNRDKLEFPQFHAFSSRSPSSTRTAPNSKARPTSSTDSAASSSWAWESGQCWWGRFPECVPPAWRIKSAKWSTFY